MAKGPGVPGGEADFAGTGVAVLLGTQGLGKCQLTDFGVDEGADLGGFHPVGLGGFVVGLLAGDEGGEVAAWGPAGVGFAEGFSFFGVVVAGGVGVQAFEVDTILVEGVGCEAGEADGFGATAGGAEGGVGDFGPLDDSGGDFLDGEQRVLGLQGLYESWGVVRSHGVLQSGVGY